MRRSGDGSAVTEVDREGHGRADPPEQDQPVGPQSADHCDGHLEERDPEPVTAADSTGEDPDRWEWL